MLQKIKDTIKNWLAAARIEKDKWYLVSCYVKLDREKGLIVESFAISPKK